MTTAKDKTATKLNVTFEGPDLQEGASLDDFQETLNHVQNAVRRMIQHLRGDESSRLLKSAKQMGSLRIVGITPGSVVAELELPQANDEQANGEKLGERAIDEILSWEGEDDDSLPKDVAEELQAIGINVSADVQTVRLGNPYRHRSVTIPRKPKPVRRRHSSQIVEVVLYGSLNEVDWSKRTAQLHRYGEAKHVKLRFRGHISEDMRRFATQYVKIRGFGKLNANDQWQSVDVHQIEPTRSHDEGPDLETLLSDPNPKFFDPDTVVRVSEPFDVDEFNKVIHDARDDERELMVD